MCMKKYGYLFGLCLILWLCSKPLVAQQVVTDDVAAQMISKINATAKQLKSMSCSFVQTKTLKMLHSKMVSQGVMYYKQPALLRWEYTSPYQYVFVLNGQRVVMRNSKRTDVIDIKQNKIFQQITQIMMSSFTGECLTDKSNFKVEMMKDGDWWIANLTPEKKELKQMFASICITFDSKALMVTQVELKEKSGDHTLIVLKNVRKNEAIDAHVFEE